MQRLAQFDVSRQFLSRPAKLAAQVGFGGLCALAMIGLRTFVNVWAPVSGPFALIYPAVLLATLYGHWRGGVTAFVLSFLWAWYVVLPTRNSFAFVDPTDPARVMLNAACCAIVIVFAEAFRRAAQANVDEIRRDADRRLTLLAELEHRTKNNFALVASMLEIQKRHLDDPALDGPLTDAVSRVRTFADAYSNLASEQAEETEIAVKPYLDILLDRLEKSAIPAGVTLYREIERATLPREVAVAIGLYLNEAIANCAKYAFSDAGESPGAGTIGVFFHVRDGEWRLSIDDDGAGAGATSDGAGGLGSRLMAAFATQAGARHLAGPLPKGFRTELVSTA